MKTIRQTLTIVAMSSVLAACGPPFFKGPALPTTPLPVLDHSKVEARAQPSTLPANWQHGGFIEIFVRAFNDSNGDGIGDLRGVTQKLDYLKDLGVKGIWMMPIHPSEDGDHGYAVNDFRAIAPEFGTLADFDELIAEAHKRGIGIVMDYLINHSATHNPFFRHSASSPQSAYRDWFVWEKEPLRGWDAWGVNPWYIMDNGAYLAQFHHSMPDWNLRNRKVVEYHKDNLRFWLNRGVDGFRFDAVTHLIENGPGKLNDQPENYALLRELDALIKSYPNRYFVCEGTGDPAGYGKACGSAFAFGINGKLIAGVKGDGKAMKEVAAYFEAGNAHQATLLANHDEFAGRRLWDQFEGNVDLYKLASATLLTLPGVPFIYYGEEVGMSAGLGLKGDPSLRSPMSWTGDTATAGFTTGKPFRALASNVAMQNLATQVGKADSLHAHYRALFNLRNARASLARGEYRTLIQNDVGYVFERRLGDERTMIAFNYGKLPLAMNVSGLTGTKTLVALLGKESEAISVREGVARVVVEGQGFQVYAAQ